MFGKRLKRLKHLKRSYYFGRLRTFESFGALCPLPHQVVGMGQELTGWRDTLTMRADEFARLRHFIEMQVTFGSC